MKSGLARGSLWVCAPKFTLVKRLMTQDLIEHPCTKTALPRTCNCDGHLGSDRSIWHHRIGREQLLRVYVGKGHFLVRGDLSDARKH
eukprot:1088885-Amphidinium_carterae.2